MNTVVSLASLASAATVSSPSIAESNPDAELVALAARFEEALLRYHPIDYEHSVLGQEVHARADVRADLQEVGRKFRSPDEAEEWSKHLGVLGEETGFHALNQRLMAIHTELEGLSRAIEAAPCHSLAGLRAKTLASLFMAGDLWREPLNDMNWDDRMHRQLFDALVSLTGAPKMPSLRLPETVNITDEDRRIGKATQRRLVRKAKDPIFAAIERHRAAVLAYFEAAKPPFEMNDDDPRYTDLHDAMCEAMNKAGKAGQRLAKTVPSTMEGILALIDHVEAVNHGRITLATDSGWSTSPVSWPPGREIEGEDMFGFDLLSHVGRALSTLTAVPQA